MEACSFALRVKPVDYLVRAGTKGGWDFDTKVIARTFPCQICSVVCFLALAQLFPLGSIVAAYDLES